MFLIRRKQSPNRIVLSVPPCYITLAVLMVTYTVFLQKADDKVWNNGGYKMSRDGVLEPVNQPVILETK